MESASTSVHLLRTRLELHLREDDLPVRFREARGLSDGDDSLVFSRWDLIFSVDDLSKLLF